jgi:hypothetical protein
MSCPGLHCPGCSSGQSAGIAALAVVGLVVADRTVQWVAERVVWISATTIVCFALAVAAGMWLERCANRRGARYAAAHGILSRADVILPYPVRAVAADPGRPAIAPAQITINIFGVPSPEQAAADPGWVPARMGGAGASDDLTAGHQTQVWLATQHDVTPRTGGYWYHQQVQAPHPASQDEDFQAHLIEVLESQPGIPLD